MPVSSLTTKTRASDCSEIPIAERWRVPNSWLRLRASVKGSRQLAATIRLPRITTAPSCKGVSGSKILSSKLSEIKPSIGTPVSILSSKPVSRSKTINAPIFLRLIISVALVTAFSISSSSFSSSSLCL